MTSKVIRYHTETNELALLSSLDESGNEFYWIGAYSKHMTHQNGEPNFYWVAGDYDDLELAQEILFNLGKDFC